MLGSSSVPLRCQEYEPSLSFSGFLRKAVPKPLGVPIGVVSGVEKRPGSLRAGERCNGGGFSRESSFAFGFVDYLGRRRKNGEISVVECAKRARRKSPRTRRGWRRRDGEGQTIKGLGDGALPM